MSAPQKSAFQGIALMVLAMACFAVADTFVKITSNQLSPPLVMFFLIAGALVLFAGTALVQGESLLDRRALAPIMWLRYVAEVVAMLGMVMALTYVPLSIVGAITQASPLLVVFGAVVWLGETVSWRRWTALAVGFLGVLLIVQPGGASFDASVLWAVLATIGLAVRDLTTRLVPPGLRASSLGAFSMLAATPVTVAWLIWAGEARMSPPPNIDWLMVITMVLLGSLGYALLIVSLRIAEISRVTPYRYSRVLFLLVIGVVVFGERPNWLVLLGACLIVGSGLYTMWRERQVSHQTPPRA